VKRLFDQNLSHKLVPKLADLFPDSAHVRDFNLKEAGDPAVWDFAREHQFTIVSKDSDFQLVVALSAAANIRLNRLARQLTRMCIFSQPVQSVNDTQISGRALHR
jgi:predicted nuclease of predicted toxin-antitoxin system